MRRIKRDPRPGSQVSPATLRRLESRQRRLRLAGDRLKLEHLLVRRVYP